MLQKFTQKFLSLSPLLKAIASIIGLLGVLGGGYAIGNVSLFQTTNHTINNYINEDKGTSKENPIKSNGAKQSTIETPKSTTLHKSKSSIKKTENNTISFFSEQSLKTSTQTTIAFFIKKQGVLDSKMIRQITQSSKQSNLNSRLLFDSRSLNYFENFMSPTSSFLQKTKIENYTDYYFICEVVPLETVKTQNRDTYTSQLEIEGYLVNVKNNNIIPFNYNTVKGAGFTKNDANQNANEDLINKIIVFVNSNFNSL